MKIATKSLPARPSLIRNPVGGRLAAPSLSTATLEAKPIVQSPSRDYIILRMLAESFYDAQEHRKVLANRAKGHIDPPAEIQVALELAERCEHSLALGLHRTYRSTAAPSVRAWQKANKGIGEHLFSRLLGHLGDPRIATPHHWVKGGPNGKRTLVTGEPYERSIGQLWSYCGHGDPARKPEKGMTQDEAFALGSPMCKMALHLLAEACVKAGVRDPCQTCGHGPSSHPGEKACDGKACECESFVSTGAHAISRYGEFYLARRAATTERVHAVECRRCGPSGEPAQVGSPWPKAHQYNDALRVLGKEILRDLWIAAGNES